ncbi:hypothetical protein ABZ419_11015 [Streptomyces cinnamoneus]|uniref:hypothetical protein n=1 Tax=Streptomyces cinnamoneus TaxID=53446 RepID=UPI0033C09709
MTEEGDGAPAGTLALDHENGVLVLRLGGGGRVIPKAIPVLDEEGRLLAVYAAAPAAPGAPPVPLTDHLDVPAPDAP